MGGTGSGTNRIGDAESSRPGGGGGARLRDDPVGGTGMIRWVAPDRGQIGDGRGHEAPNPAEALQGGDSSPTATPGSMTVKPWPRWTFSQQGWTGRNTVRGSLLLGSHVRLLLDFGHLPAPCIIFAVIQIVNLGPLAKTVFQVINMPI